ncbi:MAG TPA: carboxypeptidase regulatory-like domain-containing protein [Vicinamibacterales bacterium]|nr:carboxypeptidase regulatory-like domain-containing protein [Vicinamibacterales bacterium]
MRLSIVLLLLALVPGIALAQGQSGSIAGVVKDATGAVLPGVTVEASSPALIEKTRTAVTDGSGAYKIINLTPGTYSVTFTLTGFGTVKREGIELTAAFTANVNADMKVGAVEETINVTGASPIVDVQNVVQKTTSTREVMDALPTDRNFVSFAAMQPGVFVTGVSQNVGGSVPETGMNLVVHGSRAGDSLVLVDGMAVINGSGNGGLQYGNYMNNSMMQEITFQTAGNSAEFERASVVSNMILKDGSNMVTGSFEGRFTNQSLESNNLDSTQIAQGLKSANLVNKIWDINPVFGAPIIKDRMWIFGGYRHWGTYNNVAGSFKDASFTEKFYSCNPDANGNCTTEQNLFPVWHQSAAAHLTTQATPRNKFSAYYDWQFTDFGNCFVPSYLTAISACPEYKNIPQYIIQASWSSPISNKLLLEAGGTLTAQDFHGFPQAGIPVSQFSITDLLAPAGMPRTWGSSTGYGANRSDQYNYRASLSYVTGSHSMKVGGTLMHQWRYATQEPNNSVSLTLRGGQPFSLTEFATPIQYHETVNYNMGLFAQDQWTVKRLTANYGVRFDFLNAQVDAQSLAAGPFTPARNLPGVQNVPNWKDVDPRFGVAYDLFGDGKTALKASIGRYVVADSYTIARAVNPEAAYVNTTSRPWSSDPSGQLNPYLDCDLANPLANGSCGPVQFPTFGTQGTPTTTYDPSIVTGWGVRPYNWELETSVQQQVAPRVSVYAGYTRRWYGNLYATDNLAVTNASYTPFCINVPTAPGVTGLQLPNAGGQQCGYYDLIKPTAQNNVVKLASDLGVNLHDIYDGFDLDANARLPKGALVSGGVNFGRERTNSCDLLNNLSIVFQSGVGAGTGSGFGTQAPRASAFCDVAPPFQPSWKGQVAYTFPWQVNGSISYQNLPGAQINAQYPLTNTTAGLTLGRNFSSTPPTVDLVAPGTTYLPRINQTDIRFSKTIKIGSTTIRPNLSVYNLFNANPTNTNNAYNALYGPAWLAPTVIMTPRFMDIGVQIDF